MKGHSRSGLQARAYLIAVIGLGILAVLNQERLLNSPNLDWVRIQQIAQGTVLYDDKSFLFIGNVYRLLGMARNHVLAQFFGYAAFIIVLLAVVRTRDLSRTGPVILGLTGVTVLLSAVFLAQYAKDVLVLVVTVVVGCGRHPSRRREATSIVLMLLVANYMRSYWALIAVAYIGLRWLIHRGTSIRCIAALTVLGFFFLALAFNLRLDEELNYARVATNDLRAGRLEVNTMIRDYLPTSTIPLQVLDILITGLMLVIPLPLAYAGGPVYALIAIFTTTLWLSAAVAALRYMNERRVGGSRDVIMERSIALLGAMVCVQALFEPDYGSYLRHLTPLLPLFIAIGLPMRGRRDGAGEGERELAESGTRRSSL